jgi:putative Mn2+ efflux pump MntP
VRLGGRLGEAFAHRAELAGGIVLILIGCKILGDHLSA